MLLFVETFKIVLRFLVRKKQIRTPLAAKLGRGWTTNTVGIPPGPWVLSGTEAPAVGPELVAEGEGPRRAPETITRHWGSNPPPK